MTRVWFEQRSDNLTTFQISHTTTYRYRRKVSLGPHRLVLRPRDSHALRLISTLLTCSPPVEISWSEDVFGNSIAMASFREPAERLTIESRLVLEQYAPAWPVFHIAGSAITYPFTYSDDERIDLGELRTPRYSDTQGRFKAWAHGFVRGDTTDTLSLLKDINAGISKYVFYQSREEEGTQTPLATLDRGWGSCRDIAVLFIEAARCLGFGARVVSGYLNTDPQISATTAVRGIGSTHAWADVYLPGAGWVTFDPTNGTVGAENLIRVAVARDITQIMPIAGSFIGAKDDFLGMDVVVSVSRVA